MLLFTDDKPVNWDVYHQATPRVRGTLPRAKRSAQGRELAERRYQTLVETASRPIR